jgi:DNA-directed RNA polymerase specialized sigma24 family protein
VRQLFDRCVTGDGQARRDLHRTYYPVACRFLTRMGVTGADQEDSCQEVFVQVFRRTTLRKLGPRTRARQSGA